MSLYNCLLKSRTSGNARAELWLSNQETGSGLHFAVVANFWGEFSLLESVAFVCLWQTQLRQIALLSSFPETQIDCSSKMELKF